MNSIRLRKSLIVFCVIIAMITAFIVNLSMCNVCYADTPTTVEEDEESAEEEAFSIGVNRADTLESNQEIFRDNVLNIGKVIFAFVVFIMIIIVGINAIVNCYDGKQRAQVVEKFKHILYGVILFSIAGVIVAFATNFQEDLINDLYSVEYSEIEAPEAYEETLDTNWLANILEMGLKIIGKVIEYILEFLFNIVSGNLHGALDTGHYNLNNVLFLANFPDTIDVDFVNDYGQKLSTAPFTVDEWARYTKAYFYLSTVAVPIMLLALIKAAYDMVVNSGNFEKAMEVKKTVMRIAAGIIIVVLGPYLFRAVLLFFNMLVFLIPVEFTFDIVIEDIDDANGLLSVITSLWWLWIKFRIILLFVVREIMLTVMYIVTPVVIGFWTLSEKTKAFNKWIGETVTNAATQFCYAMVFFIATVVLSGAHTNAFFTLLWLSMMLKLADFFKESFQNLFDKWSGINEASIADSMAGAATKWTTNAATSTLDVVDSNRVGKTSRLLGNTFAFVDFAQSGKISGFTTKAKAFEKQTKTDKADATDLIKNVNAVKNQPSYKSLVSGSDSKDLAGLVFDSQFASLGNYFKNSDAYNHLSDTAKLEFLYNSGQYELAKEFASEHQYDDNVKYVARINEEAKKAREDFDKAAIGYKYAKEVRNRDFLKGSGKAYVQKYMDPFNDEAYDYTMGATLKSINGGGNRSQGPMPQPQAAPVQRMMKIGDSKINMSEDYFRSQLQKRGIEVTQENLDKEINNVQMSINEKMQIAADAISTQSSAPSITDKATRDMMSSDVKTTSKEALDRVIDFYKGSGEKADPKMVTRLKEYSKALGYNGEIDEQKKYNKAISEISKKND